MATSLSKDTHPVKNYVVFYVKLPTDKQTHKQIRKRWIKHILRGGGNNGAKKLPKSKRIPIQATQYTRNITLSMEQVNFISALVARLVACAVYKSMT